MVQRRDIMSLAAVNVLIAASGIIATMQIAWLFGANRTTDVWFLAASLTSGIFGLTQSGQLSELFLPEYIRIKHQFGQQKAFECYCVVFNWAVFATLIITGITFISSKIIVDYAGSGFAADQKITLLEIFKFLLPLIPLQIIGAVQQMIGNAEKKFGKFELGALLGSVLSIISVFILHKSMGLWALVISQWILQLTILIYRHIQLRKAELRYRWVWKTDQFKISDVIKQLGQTSLYVFSTQIYSITFRSLIGALPGGILSAYSYAESLYLRTNSLFIVPVGKVFFTSVATSFAVEPLKVLADIKSALSYYLEMYFLVLVAGLPALGHILSALWGSNRYGPELITITQIILTVFFTMILFQMYASMSRKINLAMGCYNLQYTLSTSLQWVSIIVAFILVPKFGIWGAVGTVLLNTVGMATVGWFVTYKSRPNLAVFFSRYEFIEHGLALIPALVIGVALSFYLGTSLEYQTVTFGHKFLHGLVAIVSVASSVSAYKYCLHILTRRKSEGK